MGRVFTTSKTITFRDSDPAQIMFFGHIFGYAHDAFESFLSVAGVSWNDYFKNPHYMIPIRQTEADYYAPFFPGQTYLIEVTVAQIKSSSFQMKYVFRQDEQVHSVVTMVHSVLDIKTRQKSSIPEEMKAWLSPFLEQPETRTSTKSESQ